MFLSDVLPALLFLREEKTIAGQNSRQGNKQEVSSSFSVSPFLPLREERGQSSREAHTAGHSPRRVNVRT